MTDQIGKDAEAALWRASVLELLEAIVAIGKRQEAAMAALAGVLVARKPGGVTGIARALPNVGTIRQTMDGGVADRAMELLRKHQETRWARLMLPTLRTLKALGGEATRSEVIRQLRCNPRLFTHAVVELEAKGFLEIVIRKTSTKRSVETYRLTKVADMLGAIGADVPDGADIDAHLADKLAGGLLETT